MAHSSSHVRRRVLSCYGLFALSSAVGTAALGAQTPTAEAIVPYPGCACDARPPEEGMPTIPLGDTTAGAALRYAGQGGWWGVIAGLGMMLRDRDPAPPDPLGTRADPALATASAPSDSGGQLAIGGLAASGAVAGSGATGGTRGAALPPWLGGTGAPGGADGSPSLGDVVSRIHRAEAAQRSWALKPLVVAGVVELAAGLSYLVLRRRQRLLSRAAAQRARRLRGRQPSPRSTPLFSEALSSLKRSKPRVRRPAA